jgi:hypothetical protein
MLQKKAQADIWLLTKILKTHIGKKRASLTSDDEKIGHPCVKDWNYISISHPLQKINSKWIKDLNWRPDTSEALEGYKGETFRDAGIAEELFN